MQPARKAVKREPQTPRVTVTDNMTPAQLAQALKMPMSAVEEQLAALGESVASSEDMCALFTSLCD